MIHFIEKKTWWFLLSGMLMAASIGFLLIGGLKLGIDFTGGTIQRVHFSSSRPSVETLQQTLAPLNLGQINVQPVGDSDAALKMPFVTNDQRLQVLEKLRSLDPSLSEEGFETIGPLIGSELRQRSQVAIVIVLISIILYISWAFRQVSQGPVPSWVYGLAAIMALFHDILITVGWFAMLGWFFNVEIDILFVTALLTILGFSVHDTIVVFDRIRERIKLSEADSFTGIVNESIHSTLLRSLNTSLTTLLVLIALLIFGGASIHYFVMALTVGIIIGTYSSIFIASPLLVVYERFRSRRQSS